MAEVAEVASNTKKVATLQEAYDEWCAKWWDGTDDEYGDSAEHSDSKADGGPVASSEKRVRHWSVTVNNPRVSDWDDIKDCTGLRGVCGQMECGEEGTKHLQLFVYYEGHGKTFDECRRDFPRAHVERAKNPKKLMEYVMKAETAIGKYFEYGIPHHQGYRTDIHSVAELVVKGVPIFKIAIEHAGHYVKYHKGLERLRDVACRTRRSTKPRVCWLYGAAGTGKTKLVFDTHPASDIYVKDGTKWWNAYDGEKVVLIDDFDGEWPFRDLLRLLDRYPYQGQTKGDYVKINCDYIYITCEHPPEYFWARGNELDQVLRRIDEIKCLDPDLSELKINIS